MAIEGDNKPTVTEILDAIGFARNPDMEYELGSSGTIYELHTVEDGQRGGTTKRLGEPVAVSLDHAMPHPGQEGD